MNCKPSVILLTLAAILVTAAAHADLVTTIAQVKPAIAIVGTYKATNSPRFTLHGTGFVVGDAGEGNRLVTNAHVLVPPADADPDATLVVQLRAGNKLWQTRPAKVLEVDVVHDLALLRFDGPAVTAFKVRSSDKVQEGQSVAFMGFPIGGALGFSPVTHRATISSITPAALPTPTASQLNPKVIRSVRSNSPFDIFQLDGTAYPGNSGGPLFDPDTGEVLGVVNMVLIKGTRESALSHPSGISYAVPSSYVLKMMERNAAN
jgi:serine protease Do